MIDDDSPYKNPRVSKSALKMAWKASRSAASIQRFRDFGPVIYTRDGQVIPFASNEAEGQARQIRIKATLYWLGFDSLDIEDLLPNLYASIAPDDERACGCRPAVRRRLGKMRVREILEQLWAVLREWKRAQMDPDYWP